MTSLSLNYSLPTMIVVATVLFLVIATTAFGNLLVGVALVRYRYLRTTSNFLIGNLALSDFLLATTILPLSTLNECLGYWTLGQTMCNLWLLTDVLYCTASLWNICVIAFDRFTATLYPIWYRERRSARQAALYVATVWLISSAICLPPLFGWNDLAQNYVFNTDDGAHHCVLFQTPSYVLYSALGSFFVPFFLTLFLYVQIFVVLRKRIRRMRSSASSETLSSWQRAGRRSRSNFRHSASTLALPEQPEVELTSFVDLHSGYVEETSSRSFFSTESGAAIREEGRTEGGGDVRRPTRLNIDYSVDGSGLMTSPSPASPRKSSVQLLSRLRLPHWTGSYEDFKCPDAVPSFTPRGSFRLPISGAHAQKPSIGPETECVDRIRIIATDSENEAVTTLLVVENFTNGAQGHRTVTTRSLGQTLTGGCPCCPIGQRTVNLSREGLLSGRRRQMTTEADRKSVGGGSGSSRRVTGQHRRFEQREIQATVRMAIIIAFFCGMWIGFFTVYVVHGWAPGSDIPRELDAFFFWLGYSNSSINPILYTIFNEDFRRAFLKILRPRKSRNNARNPRHRL